MEQMKIEEVLAEKGFYVSTTSGLSMFPMLRDRRDTIVLSPVKGQLKKYDVPLYHSGDKHVLHRIISVKPDYYIIRGDNCIQKEIVTKDQIIGVLTEFYRGEKKISMQGIGYKCYVRFWHYSYPIRRVAKYVRGKLCRK